MLMNVEKGLDGICSSARIGKWKQRKGERDVKLKDLRILDGCGLRVAGCVLHLHLWG